MIYVVPQIEVLYINDVVTTSEPFATEPPQNPGGGIQLPFIPG